MVSTSRVSRKYCLIITATVNPGDYADALKHEFIGSREKDYENALRFWLTLDAPQLGDIVFCENSNFDLTLLKENIAAFAKTEKVERTIEWLSFDGNNRPEGFHYGYAELGLIDYAVQISTLLKRYSYFVKATGRLTFPNISRLLNVLPSNYDFAADWHRFPKDKTSPRRVRTQLLFFKASFYKTHLLSKRNSMTKDQSHVEELLAKILWPLRSRYDLICRFPIECQPEGVSASHGTRYNSGVSKIKSIIRGVLRRVAPNLWM